MKYKTFVRLRAAAVALIGLGAIAGIFFGCRSGANEPAALMQPDSPTVPEVQPRRDSTLPGPASNRSDDGSARNYTLTDIEREVLSLQKEPLTNGTSDGKSRKWVIKTSRFKAEFRSDEDKGFDYWNRVKIDLNNNKKYEERWDFKPDTVKRRVAPNDDENYTEEYRLQGETWVRK